VGCWQTRDEETSKVISDINAQIDRLEAAGGKPCARMQLVRKFTAMEMAICPAAEPAAGVERRCRHSWQAHGAAASGK
jgi:hypothetical protein